MQVMQFNKDDAEPVDSVDYFLAVLDKLGLISVDCSNSAWNMAFARYVSSPTSVERMFQRSKRG